MLNGIDVSNWQGVINWQKVKDSGVQFAGIKATQGVGIPDGWFPRNWERSRLRGVRRIAYHFHIPELGGADQSAFFLGRVHDSGGFVPGDAAMLDIETINGATARQVITSAERFVSHFLEHSHVGLYIYTGPWFWQGVLGNPKSSILAKCPLWIATWGPEPGHIDNWPTGPALWQYTGSGSCPGIGGDVDRDRFLGTPHQYDLLARYGGRT